MYTTYIQYSSSRNRFYSGHCEEMTKRFEQHNSGRNKSTKSGIPWKIVFIMITNQLTASP
ncbi:MAG: GIY-YIG nuclease family protein [bacterium]